MDCKPSLGTRLILHGLVGLTLVIVMAASARAQTSVTIPDEVAAVADEAGVSAEDLLGAVYTTNLDARTYLCRVGEMACPRPPTLRQYAYEQYPDVAVCIERIVQVESNGWFTGGYNPVAWGRWREHATGLGGFLPSTWATTPQGKAGLSIFDGYAQVDAINFMIKAGRGREFAAVLWGRCG